MSGHSKWSQIKHQKEIADKKRGQNFSKLLKFISVAAKDDPNPKFNIRLKSAIQKAKDANVPNDTIDRAVKHASEEKNLEELIFEAYGEGGIAILIEAITDNRNRTVAEIKSILNKNGGRWAESGSVRWAFEKNSETGEWHSKFPQTLPEENLEKLKKLLNEIENHDDVQKIFTNLKS